MNYLLRAWPPEGLEDAEYFHVTITLEQAEEIIQLMDRWRQVNAQFSGLQSITLYDNGCLQGVYSHGEIHDHVVEDPEDEYIDLDEHSGIEKAKDTGGLDLWSMVIRENEVSWRVNCKHTGTQVECSMLPRKDMEEVLKLNPRHLMKSIAAGEKE